MPRLVPFRACRYVAPRGAEVAPRLWWPGLLASPQNVEQTALLRREPYHALHVMSAPQPRNVLAAWEAAGVVVREERPALYVVSLPSARRGSYGVRFLIARLETDRDLPTLEAEAPVLPGASTPIPTVAADDHHALASLLAEAAERGDRLWRIEHAGGALELFRVADTPLARRLAAAASDLKLRPLARPGGPSGVPPLLAVVPLSDPGLAFHSRHRALRALPTFESDRFLTLVKDYARIIELDRPLHQPEGLAFAREQLALLANGHHAVLLCLPDGRGRILRFRQGMDLAHVPAAPRSPTLRSLDLALLEALILRTVLGVHSLHGPEGRAQVAVVDGLEALVAGVMAGTYQVGFGLNPPPAWELRAVMEAEQTLPPSTLTLSPALPSGLLFNANDS